MSCLFTPSNYCNILIILMGTENINIIVIKKIVRNYWGLFKDLYKFDFACFQGYVY